MRPYHVARKFASIDHLSQGRAAWNIASSSVQATAANFGHDKHLAHDQRYRQAEPGKALAAEVADIIFGSSASLAGAQAFYADVKARAEKNGRNPKDVCVMPGLFTVIGKTTEEAKAKNEQLLSLVHPEVGFSLLEELLGVSLRAHDVDGLLPEDLPPSNQQKALRERLVETARREKLTIRQLYTRQIGSHGVYSMVGSPTDIAHEMEHWFREGAADGFNIMASDCPGGFADFCQLVVPELRKRGLVRTQYRGNTLREHMGLPRPVHGTPGRSSRASALASAPALAPALAPKTN